MKRVVGVGIVVAAAVGSYLGWQQITRPRVADFDVIDNEDAPDVYWVAVQNEGGPGGVRVYFRLRDQDNDVLVERTREIAMTSAGRQRLEFEEEPPEGSDEYRFEVEPTDFPENQV